MKIKYSYSTNLFMSENKIINGNLLSDFQKKQIRKYAPEYVDIN
jgi:hypothetical protein